MAVQNKLLSWGLSSEDCSALLSHLISNNFLSEERFASAYTSGKFRIKKWGRVKIRQHLRTKKISVYSIDKALKEIDPDEYWQTLTNLMTAKSRQIKSSAGLEKKIKLQRYLASKGYEQDLIIELLKES